MTHPDKEHSLALLVEWQANHDAVEKLMNGMETNIGLDPNGPLFNVVWRMFDAYTATLSVELGDYSGVWLQWYCAENGMGSKAMQAGYDGKLKQIKTLAHLYGLIAEARKREGVQP